MSMRRWLDSVTSVIVWYMPKKDEEDKATDRWTVVFYGKYYTNYSDVLGQKRHVCMGVNEDATYYYWEEYNLADVHLGRRVPWGMVPVAIQKLIQREYRRDIPNYKAKSLAECPEKFEANRRNYGGYKSRRK